MIALDNIQYVLYYQCIANYSKIRYNWCKLQKRYLCGNKKYWQRSGKAYQTLTLISTFQCNWIKNYHSPWKRCLHYSKLWISIEWSHFLAINFNWNNLHLGLSHPVPSCPILSLWAHLSGSSAVLHWFSTSVIFTRVDCACQRNCSGTPICGYLINPNMFPRFLQPNLVRLTTPLVNWLIHTLVYPYTIPSYLCVCLLHYPV